MWKHEISENEQMIWNDSWVSTLINNGREPIRNEDSDFLL